LTEKIGDARPSKSARKREMEVLQALAERLAALSDSELARLGVDARLREALALVRPMRPSGARNRQLKHCVKFIDIETLAEVRAYLDDRQSHRIAANREFHEIERWRDRLIDEGDQALQALFDSYGRLDRQRIRQLCRDAMREKQTGRPAGAGRRLFRELRDSLSLQTQKN
jgi:ribosome-associated protein